MAQVMKNSHKGREYQRATVEGRSKRRNIRFTPTKYDEIRAFAREHNWTFSRVVGEAVEWYMNLQPYIYKAIETTEKIAGEPLVLASLRNYLQELVAEAEEALAEIEGMI